MNELVLTVKWAQAGSLTSAVRHEFQHKQRCKNPNVTCFGKRLLHLKVGERSWKKCWWKAAPARVFVSDCSLRLRPGWTPQVFSDLKLSRGGVAVEGLSVHVRAAAVNMSVVTVKGCSIWNCWAKKESLSLVSSTGNAFMFDLMFETCKNPETKRCWGHATNDCLKHQSKTREGWFTDVHSDCAVKTLFYFKWRI